MKLGLIFILVLTAFLFTGGPGYHDGRIYKEISQTGHFVLFASIIFYILQFKLMQRQRSMHLILATGTFCILIGLATEILQLMIGRSFELIDVVNDVIGGYAGLFLSHIVFLFRSDKYQHNSKIKIQFLNILGFFLLAIVGSRSLIVASIDEWNIKSDFPLLAGFEAPFEMVRWNKHLAKLSISEELITEGAHSLKFTLRPSKYPSISLSQFIGDWSKYTMLNFNLYNTRTESIEIIIKIYDDQHRYHRYRYSDRYNQSITLKPGWNQFSLSLNEIKNAPENRMMNIDSINLFSLFMIDLQEPTTLYLDNLHLTNN